MTREIEVDKGIVGKEEFVPSDYREEVVSETKRSVPPCLLVGS